MRKFAGIILPLILAAGIGLAQFNDGPGGVPVYFPGTTTFDIIHVLDSLIASNLVIDSVFIDSALVVNCPTWMANLFTMGSGLREHNWLITAGDIGLSDGVHNLFVMGADSILEIELPPSVSVFDTSYSSGQVYLVKNVGPYDAIVNCVLADTLDNGQTADTLAQWEWSFYYSLGDSLWVGVEGPRTMIDSLALRALTVSDSAYVDTLTSDRIEFSGTLIGNSGSYASLDTLWSEGIGSGYGTFTHLEADSAWIEYLAGASPIVLLDSLWSTYWIGNDYFEIRSGSADSVWHVGLIDGDISDANIDAAETFGGPLGNVTWLSAVAVDSTLKFVVWDDVTWEVDSIGDDAYRSAISLGSDSLGVAWTGVDSTVYFRKYDTLSETWAAPESLLAGIDYYYVDVAGRDDDTFAVLAVGLDGTMIYMDEADAWAPDTLAVVCFATPSITYDDIWDNSMKVGFIDDNTRDLCSFRDSSGTWLCDTVLAVGPNAMQYVEISDYGPQLFGVQTKFDMGFQYRIISYVYMGSGDGWVGPLSIYGYDLDYPEQVHIPDLGTQVYTGYMTGGLGPYDVYHWYYDGASWEPVIIEDLTASPILNAHIIRMPSPDYPTEGVLVEAAGLYHFWLAPPDGPSTDIEGVTLRLSSDNGNIFLDPGGYGGADDSVGTVYLGFAGDTTRIETEYVRHSTIDSVYSSDVMQSLGEFYASEASLGFMDDSTALYVSEDSIVSIVPVRIADLFSVDGVATIDTVNTSYVGDGTGVVHILDSLSTRFAVVDTLAFLSGDSVAVADTAFSHGASVGDTPSISPGAYIATRADFNLVELDAYIRSGASFDCYVALYEDYVANVGPLNFVAFSDTVTHGGTGYETLSFTFDSIPTNGLAVPIFLGTGGETFRITYDNLTTIGAYPVWVDPGTGLWTQNTAVTPRMEMRGFFNSPLYTSIQWNVDSAYVEMPERLSIGGLTLRADQDSLDLQTQIMRIDTAKVGHLVVGDSSLFNDDVYITLDVMAENGIIRNDLSVDSALYVGDSTAILPDSAYFPFMVADTAFVRALSVDSLYGSSPITFMDPIQMANDLQTASHILQDFTGQIPFLEWRGRILIDSIKVGASNDTLDVEMLTLPARSRIVGVFLDVFEAFDDTLATLQLGSNADRDNLLDATTCFTTGQIGDEASEVAWTAVQGGTVLSWADSTALYVRLVITAGHQIRSLTTGKAVLYVLYHLM